MFWAYIAGIIDGEGTVTIIHLKGNYIHSRTGKLEPRIGIYNTNEELMRKLHTVLGGMFRTIKSRGHWQVQYYLKIRNTQTIINILEKVSPYLIVKKEQARILMEFCRRRIEENRAPYTDIDFGLHSEIMRLNLRGRAKTSQAKGTTLVPLRASSSSRAPSPSPGPSPSRAR